jgi:hypothetical protein
VEDIGAKWEKLVVLRKVIKSEEELFMRKTRVSTMGEEMDSSNFAEVTLQALQVPRVYLEYSRLGVLIKGKVWKVLSRL